MKYTPKEIKQMLKSMCIVYDTREKLTEHLEMRLKGFNCQSRRDKLDYGDYTAEYTESHTQTILSLANIIVVERKQSLSELATNFTEGRQRFTNEFEKGALDGCRIHLLIEQDNFESLYKGEYRSKLLPTALSASLHTWGARYNTHIHFCRLQTSGKLIKDILYYNLREYLINQ